MKRRTDYKICPYCGAALDIGEFCDCQQEKEAPGRPQKCFLKQKIKNPTEIPKALRRQTTAVFHMMILLYGRIDATI